MDPIPILLWKRDFDHNGAIPAMPLVHPDTLPAGRICFPAKRKGILCRSAPGFFDQQVLTSRRDFDEQDRFPGISKRLRQIQAEHGQVEFLQHDLEEGHRKNCQKHRLDIGDAGRSSRPIFTPGFQQLFTNRCHPCS